LLAIDRQMAPLAGLMAPYSYKDTLSGALGRALMKQII
jgi:hypothetical protein